MATIASNRGALDGTELVVLWFSMASATSRQAVAGANQLKFQMGLDWLCGAGNSRFLSLADGRRGTRERNCISKGFV